MSGHLLVPAVMLFTFMGAWIERSALGDWMLLLSFGVLGYLMKKGGWPRPPLVLGFILGGIMESALHLSAQTHGVASFQRPFVIVFAALFAITMVLAIRRHRKTGVGVRGAESEGSSIDAQGLSVPVSLFILGTTCFAGLTAFNWTYGSKLFPLAVVAVTLPLTAAVLFNDVKGVTRLRSELQQIQRSVAQREITMALKFGLLLLSVLLLTFVIGQFLALIAFVIAYLLVWGKCGAKITAIYAAAMAAVLYLLFETIVPVIWHPSPFFTLP